MKKLIYAFFVYFFPMAFVCAAITDVEDSKYEFTIKSDNGIKTFYSNGEQYGISKGVHSTTTVLLSDAGNAYWLNTSILSSGEAFNLDPQNDIRLYVLDKKGNKKPLKQYTNLEIQKSIKKEASSFARGQRLSAVFGGMSADGEYRTSYQNVYGQNIGYSTTVYKDYSKQKRLTENAKANIARKNAETGEKANFFNSAILKKETIFPNDLVQGIVLFKPKKGNEYILEINLDGEEHSFNLFRVKK